MNDAIVPAARRARRRMTAAGIALLAAAGLLAPAAMAHDDHEAPPGDAPTATGPGITSCGEGTERVLLLEPTVSGGCSSPEALAAQALGLAADVATGEAWSALGTDDFGAYRALVLGDPTCGWGNAAPAEANAATWASAATGNVVINGTDPVYHDGQGGNALTTKSIAFAVADAAKTGAYISLSCYYHGVEANTPVPLLQGFGSFTVTGVGCYNDAHIVATHPALEGLTDETLSEWYCSVHEAFDSWPLTFEVLAIAEGAGTTYNATDGTVGIPYIVARGVEVISDIRLDPEEQTSPTHTSVAVMASVFEDETPVHDTEVTFRVIDGPNAGGVTTLRTLDGYAELRYGSSTVGTDTIEATFVDSLGRTQRSNRVTVTWTAPPPPPPPPPPPACTEDGLSLADPTGAASAVVHDNAEPVVEGVSPDLAGTVHDVNCDVVVPLEDDIDALL